MRGEGHCFADDDGFFNPRGVTFFTWPWGLKNDEARYRQNAAWAAAHRFDFLRVWGKVGGGSWADREFNVATDPDAMARAIDVAYDEYGLRTDVALIADNFDGVDPIVAARALVDVIRSREQKVICVECANEDNMPDEGRNLPRVFDVLRGVFPDLLIVARSAPLRTRHDSNEAFLDYDADGYANVMSVHTDRQPPPERQVRQAWDAEGHRRPWGSFEPPGPWSSGATMDLPMHLAMASATTSIVGGGLYVAHLGAGIRHGGQWDRDRGLPANFFDQVDGDAQADAIVKARDLLPGDIASWRHINGHWPDAPLPPKWIWSDGFPEGVSRIYAAERGDEFWCAVIAVKGRSPHPARRNCRVAIFDPTTAEQLDERTLRAGEAVVFEGPEVGGRWGYVVKGRYV